MLIGWFCNAHTFHTINLGKKSLLVPTFSCDFHFSPKVLFLPLLVPILENVSILVPTVTSETEEPDVANGRNKKILNLY